MRYYYVETSYFGHDMEMGETGLIVPFKTKKARAADIELKRQEDEWNLEEDGVTILLLESSKPIRPGEAMTLLAAVFDEDADEEDADEDEDDCTGED